MMEDLQSNCWKMTSESKEEDQKKLCGIEIELEHLSEFLLAWYRYRWEDLGIIIDAYLFIHTCDTHMQLLILVSWEGLKI